MLEKNAWSINGYLGMLVGIILLFLSVICFFKSLIFIGIILLLITIILFSGFTIIQPNQAVVLTFFGKYIGTIRKNGLYITIPFTLKNKVSLRVRNFNSTTLKVNDVDGNPIEIAAVIVFRVIDSAKAMFNVENYERFVEIQSETALRHVATKYPYDHFDESAISLRGNGDEVSNNLKEELQPRLDVAGVEIMEARLTHLAYSTEIAGAMLQRQQASAILSARKKIVEGAVGMAQAAIEQLEKDGFELDEERKMAMINNLLVSIVSDRSSQPVINTGSLY
ncbi:SPFH domain-containing protein [Heyndrickxia ginsengihumi]|uniref:Membrane protein n=1 Tax=Heyndrickxia ginsengihumi TaxID=363870 RepID=A0A0A6VDK0_9BACI|nr:SPFH domain-containing protein [Heyndrickxia ginsengihumi]KHD85656.1 membrane protein [Heyndrickxia ginsengihumi]MBE6184122.1 SPFH domain-containing protein [Bacillus sp. (in: firmicutes)]MCM3024906.1 SPFH domain-containing protein [Heyndrickxia ginsengihumi]NEY20539.1 SPFH domain-containing protein [Heyndrickxia ginsengihumi]